jgi:ribonuclease P/MRP protein subunit POP8
MSSLAGQLHLPPAALHGHICILNCRHLIALTKLSSSPSQPASPLTVKQNSVSQSPSSSSTDNLTIRTYLTSALSQFLGVAGTAIPIDILKLDQRSSSGRPGPSPPSTLWIRVPYDDATAVIAALSSWIGGEDSNVAFRVKERGGLLGGLTAGDGAELFMPSGS